MDTTVGYRGNLISDHNQNGSVFFYTFIDSFMLHLIDSFQSLPFIFL